MAFLLPAVFALLSLAPVSFAQTTVGTGSIVGTVSDPSGAVVIGAGITITNVATGQRIELTANSSGSFNSGALIPGNYKTQVSAKGFSTGQSLDAMEALCRSELPRSMSFEWSEIAYLEKTAGSTGMMVFGLSVLFVFHE